MRQEQQFSAKLDQPVTNENGGFFGGGDAPTFQDYLGHDDSDPGDFFAPYSTQNGNGNNRLADITAMGTSEAFINHHHHGSTGATPTNTSTCDHSGTSSGGEASADENSLVNLISSPTSLAHSSYFHQSSVIEDFDPASDQQDLG